MYFWNVESLGYEMRQLKLFYQINNLYEQDCFLSGSEDYPDPYTEETIFETWKDREACEKRLAKTALAEVIEFPVRKPEIDYSQYSNVIPLRTEYGPPGAA